MKILLMLLFLTMFNIFAQSKDYKEFDSIYYSNLFKNKFPPGYYFYIPIKNNDTVYKSIVTYQTFKGMLGLYGSLEKDKEFVEIVLNALLNNDTIELKKNYPNSFEYFIFPEKYKNIADSIASFGQEYFLEYFFYTTNNFEIKQYRGEFKHQLFKFNSNTEIAQFRNAVIYHLIKWRLYVFHQGYTGNLVFCKEENIEKAIQKR